MKLHDKVVVVTGGSRGIGKAVSKLFVDEGAQVIITSKNITKLKQTAKEINCAFFIDADIKNEKQVNRAINKIIEKFGRIDVLVNNAGILPEQEKLDQIKETDWNEIIDVNLTGQFRFTKAVIPHMKKNGGSIINMSSDAGLKTFEKFYADAYVASKAAMIMLTKSWALEYAADNIRVNCICASVVDTDMTKPFWLNTENKRKSTAKEHPLGRIGTGKDIAYASLYFASDDSSWTTGSILPVDGGVSIK
ncbi:SDR family oxidoreductase [Nitrosopumilus sp.]|jgi:NAD(P)-dependent dehydrogenase (short-subunit alcohol dehydrogenase family)|nr:SDR family oxidoreductase [Nitrosopumilus sp.]